MKEAPVILLTFANDFTAYLPVLKQESTAIKNALRVFETRNFIKVEREESAVLSDLVTLLANFPNQLCIFHYSGHAGNTFLQFEDDLVHTKGLAKLLGEQANLQLVFLNGCSTKGQIDLLLEAGVKAVIATSTPIEDTKAMHFAVAFYEALANKRTIKRAFAFAKAALETKFKDTPTIELYRAGRTQLTDSTPQNLPWGLYIQEQWEDAILNWHLPYYHPVSLPKDMQVYISEGITINKYIVFVLDEMCRYNPDIYHQMVEVQGEREVKKDSSTYIGIIIQNFPWLIGSQIQLLQQQREINRQRLEQLISTYIITSQVLYYILLSNLWEGIHRSKVSLSVDFLKEHHLDQQSLLEFDFLAHLLQVYQYFERFELPLFVPEYESFYTDINNTDGFLYKSWQYLEQVKKDFISKENIEYSERLLVMAEQALAVVLKGAAFLANYQMLTVREISIDNPRYSPEAYEINMGRIKAMDISGLSLYQDAQNRRKNSYANCRSVILVHNEQNFTEYLNLSPFIIDKNAFLDIKSNKKYSSIDPFLYSYEVDGAYYYTAVKHSLFTALKNENCTDIIHTGLTLEDFDSGQAFVNQAVKQDDFGFADAFGLSSTTTDTLQGTKVFTILEKQFEQFKSDFTS